jgi:hypothetical protein
MPSTAGGGGGVGEAAARCEKGAGYRYEGTNRYHRGRVLAQLREDASASDEEIDLRDLGRRVCEGFTDEDVPWLYGVVESLRNDGLATVAEERPPTAPTTPRAGRRASSYRR